jgi:hypothetical protein
METDRQIGLLLCKRKDNALVHYALADLPNRVFVSKYQIELPTVDQLQNFLNAPAADQRLANATGSSLPRPEQGIPIPIRQVHGTQDGMKARFGRDVPE